MKQGRTEKAVFAKLSTEKVELSIKDDVIKLEKRAEGFRSEALKQLQGAITSYEAAAQSHGTAMDIAERGLSQAKELGADELVKYLQKSVDFNKGTISTIERAVNDLKANRVK